MRLQKNIKHLGILLTTLLGALLMMSSQVAFAAGSLPSQRAANERVGSGEITTQVPIGQAIRNITNNGGPGPIDHYSVSSINSTQTAGAAFSVTIQAQDAISQNITAGIDASENITITFGKPDAGATPVWVITANGTATVNMTMTVAQTSENLTFTGVSSNKTGSSNSFDVNAGGITRLAFTTSPQTLIAGTVSSNLTLQTRDIFSNSANVSSNTTISLTSTSANGTFYSDAAGTTNITSVTILSGTNSASFYYKDTATGTASITVAESPSQGWTDATQTEVVNAGAITRLAFTTSPQTLIAGTVSSNLTLQTRDIFSNSANVSSNTTISLTSTSANGTFYSDAAGTTNITSVTILSGTNSASFYYKDSATGAASITAAESPSQGWTDATQTESIIIGTVHHYSVSSITSPQTAGGAFLVSIQAQDSNSNNITSGSEASENITISFGLTDTAATPLSTNTTGGMTTVNMTMTVARTGQTVIFTGVSSNKTGTSNSFAVNPRAIHHYTVSGISSPQTVGTAFDVTVRAQDTYNNNITGGSDASENITISFGLTDSFATPLSANTTSGTRTVSMTMRTVQTGQTIIFTGATSNKTGTSNSFNVNPVPTSTGVTVVGTGATSTGVFTQTVVAQSSDTRVTLVIPANTVGLTRDGLAISQISIVQSIAPSQVPPNSGVVGNVYDFGPEGATFSPPITLTMSYDPGAVPTGVAANNLVIAYYDTTTSKWVNLTSTVNTSTNTVSVLVSHFTAFTVLAYTPPAAFTVGSLTVTPAQINIGANVDISVVVSNTGGLSGTYSVVLKINGAVLDTREITLAAGTNQKVSFGVTQSVPGTYTVDVGGLAGSFIVRAPPVAAPKPAAFTVSSLTISPNEANIGDNVTISALVTNTGGQSGSYTVTLKINNILVTTRTLTLAGGANQMVAFTTATLTTAGTYTVSLDSLSGTFTVKPTVTTVKSSSSPVKWILIAGGAVGAIVIVVVIAWLVRRREDQDKF